MSDCCLVHTELLSFCGQTWFLGIWICVQTHSECFAGDFCRSFWRAGLADAELEGNALIKLLDVLSEGDSLFFATPCRGFMFVQL